MNKFYLSLAYYLSGGLNIYIGIDDTDSTAWMCTTYLALELISELREFDVIGYPKLVRLNPNIPWKTRGNGAIAIHFGVGKGERIIIGECDGKRYHAFSSGRNVQTDIEIKKRVQEVVERFAQFQDDSTNPAFVIFEKKPSPSLYWKAVREIVRLSEIKEVLREKKVLYKGWKNERGLIGAVSAVSWRPRDRTYEIIAYREKRRWGSKRSIDVSSVKRMDKKFGSTFNNYDYKNRHLTIAPNSPCPVLFGIRGECVEELIQAMLSIKSECIDRWIIFETNQGTDEHLVKTRISEIKPYNSVIAKGRVSSEPRTIKGGHVIFSLSDGKEIECTAYEPTKEFRDAVRALRLGDVLTVYGSVREKPFTINLEKLKVERLAEIKEKISNPVCKRCGKGMKSAGKGRGYKCQKCGGKAGEEEAKFKVVERNLKEKFYEVPVCARRHLSKPLKRMKL